LELLRDSSVGLCVEDSGLVDAHPPSVVDVAVVPSVSQNCSPLPLLSSTDSLHTSTSAVSNDLMSGIGAVDMRDEDILEDYDEVGLRYDGSLFVGRSYKENPMAYDDIGSVVPVDRKQSSLQSSDASDANPVDFLDELLIANFADVNLQENNSSAFAVEFDSCDGKDGEACINENDDRRRQFICCSDVMQSADVGTGKVCETDSSCEQSIMLSCVESAIVVPKCHTSFVNLKTADDESRQTVNCMQQNSFIPQFLDHDCTVQPTRHIASPMQLSNGIRILLTCSLENKLPKDQILLASGDELPRSPSNKTCFTTRSCSNQDPATGEDIYRLS